MLLTLPNEPPVINGNHTDSDDVTSTDAAGSEHLAPSFSFDSRNKDDVSDIEQELWILKCP